MLYWNGGLSIAGSAIVYPASIRYEHNRPTLAHAAVAVPHFLIMIFTMKLG